MIHDEYKFEEIREASVEELKEIIDGFNNYLKFKDILEREDYDQSSSTSEAFNNFHKLSFLQVIEQKLDVITADHKDMAPATYFYNGFKAGVEYLKKRLKEGLNG